MNDTFLLQAPCPRHGFHVAAAITPGPTVTITAPLDVLTRVVTATLVLALIRAKR